MSDVGLNASLELDIRSALAQIDQLGRRLDEATQVTLRADASLITSAIDAAIAAAVGEVDLDADAAPVTAAIDAAVDAADDEVRLSADVAGITASIDDAVGSAQPDITVQADARPVGQAIDDEVAAARPEIPVRGDTTDLNRALKDLVADANEQLSGLDLDVEFDIGRVRAIARQIKSEIETADPRVTVTANTDRVVAGVREALQRDLDATIAQANAAVDVTADASQVTGAIDAAVDASDTSLQITADASSVDGATRSVDALDAGLVGAASSGGQLGRAIGGLSIAGAAAGIYGLVDAASQLEQSVGGTTAIFGDAEGRVVGFAQSAAEAAGLTEESARSLTSQLGGLLQGFGFTQTEAARLSVELSTLGADLAATFGGTAREAVEALGAALRGETDPIERYGLSLNATRADLKAVELGLAANTTNVSANARAQASLAIITEQSANAQGQFAREASTTAGQVERARAEFGNMAAEVGSNLQPTINQLLATARSDLIPALGDLGESLGPALATALTASLPLLGSATDVLIAGTPAIQAFASALDAIPDPILAAAATAFVAQRAFGVLDTGLDLVARGLSGIILPAGNVSGAFNRVGADSRNMRQGLGSVLSGISPLTVALTAGAVAFSLWSERQAQAAELTRNQAADVDAFANSLTSSQTAVRGYVAALEQMLSAGEDIVVNFGKLRGEADLGDVLRDSGVSVDQLSEAVRSGDAAVQRLLDTIEGGSENETIILRNAVKSLADTMQEGAQQSIDAGVALDDYSRSAADNAIALTQNADGSANYAAALDVLNERQRENAQSAEEAAAQQDALASAVGGVDSTGATQRLTGLGLTLTALRDGVGPVEPEFVRFAQAMDAAGLSGEELDAVAADLGTDADTLSAAISRTVDPINDLRNAAAGTIPSIQDIATGMEDFSVEGFRDELAEAYDAIVNFRANLIELESFSPRLAAAAATLGPEYAATLAEGLRAGRTDVLAESDLYIAGIEQQLTGLDADMQNDLGPRLGETSGEIGTLITESFGGAANLYDRAIQNIREAEGAFEGEGEAFRQSGFNLGASATEGFGEGHRPDVAPGILQADQGFQASIEPIRGRGLQIGVAGREGFQAGFRPDPNPGITAADQAVVSRTEGWLVRNALFGQSGSLGFVAGFRPDPGPGLASADAGVASRQGSFLTRLRIFGESGRSGLRSGMDGMSTDAGNAASGAVGAVTSRYGEAYSGGSGLGSNIGSGFIAGLNSMIDRAKANVGAFMDAALEAGRSQAGIASPSKVWRDKVGKEIGAGLALGILDSTADVEAAMASTIDAALAAARGGIDAGAVPIDATAALAAGSTTATLGGSVVFQLAPGAVQISVTGATDPRAAGEQAWLGFEGAARSRGVALTAALR